MYDVLYSVKVIITRTRERTEDSDGMCNDEMKEQEDGGRIEGTEELGCLEAEVIVKG